MGDERWIVVQADAVEFLRAQPADSLDLVFGSPPYEQARLYLENGTNMGISRKTDEWVAWMVEVYKAASVACKGLVAFVVAGQTRQYRWSAGPALLMAELHRAGLNLRNPPIFSRVGIPGSGGPDWLRADYEWIVCTSRPGRLPWSDNTACGHPPKWAPGGEMSHRQSNGARVNQWGHPIDSGATTVDGDDITSGGKRPSHREANFGHNGDGSVKGGHARDIPRRSANGHGPAGSKGGTKTTRLVMTTKPRGSRDNGGYNIPALANPGNIIEANVGGGVMGDPLCHDNEAPFPEKLAEFFVLSFAPPGGLVSDVFSGSGTTAAVSVRHGRRFVGCDLRASQVELSHKRIRNVTPDIFTAP